MKKSILLLSLLTLTNCISVDKYTSKFKDEDWGPSKGYKQKIENHLYRVAKNPLSVQILNFGKPKKTFVQNLRLSAMTEPFYPAWGVCVRWLGENSFGGLVASTENFYIRKGEVLLKDDSVTMSRFQPCNNG